MLDERPNKLEKKLLLFMRKITEFKKFYYFDIIINYGILITFLMTGSFFFNSAIVFLKNAFISTSKGCQIGK
jgi:hypothetical protein